MGRSVYLLDSLLPPLALIQERVVTVPAGQVMEVKGTYPPLIAFFLEGRLELELEDGSQLSIYRGDAVILGAGVNRMYQPSVPGQPATLHLLLVKFAPDLLPLPEESKNICTNKFRGLLERYSKGLHHFPQGLERISGRDTLGLIRKEIEAGATASEVCISGLAISLIARLLRLEEAELTRATKPLVRGEAAVEHACQFMRERMHERLTLTDVAWSVQLSGEHLERQFKKFRGCSVFHFLNQVRLEQAKHLLLTSDLPVMQIAGRCGFTSSTHLGRHLKKDTGLTPVEYRLAGRRNEVFTPSNLRFKQKPEVP